MKKFGLIGYGAIASRHLHAINMIHGLIWKVFDPKLGNPGELNDTFFKDLDYVVICSPSYLHREHIKLALSYDKKIIVEKPMLLPWEPIIDDDRINIVLQFRWLDLPDKADLVKVIMVRDKKYFQSWKGNPKNTGGLFYHLFIHYIDLAIQLNAEFEGLVCPEGEQIRKIDDFDLMKVDMDDLYFKMYKDILNGKGIKPKDIFYLHWILNKCNDIYGLGTEAINQKIHVGSTL